MSEPSPAQLRHCRGIELQCIPSSIELPASVRAPYGRHFVHQSFQPRPPRTVALRAERRDLLHDLLVRTPFVRNRYHRPSTAKRNVEILVTVSGAPVAGVAKVAPRPAAWRFPSKIPLALRWRRTTSRTRRINKIWQHLTDLAEVRILHGQHVSVKMSNGPRKVLVAPTKTRRVWVAHVD